MFRLRTIVLMWLARKAWKIARSQWERRQRRRAVVTTDSLQ